MTNATLETLNYSVQHIRGPIRAKSDEWQETADQWLVTFKHKDGFFTVDYFTGIGHRKKIKRGYYEETRPISPSVKDIVYSLYSDAQLAQENFNDFCDNLGYSSDSIKVLNIYKACMDSVPKLRKLGLSNQYLQETYKDY